MIAYPASYRNLFPYLVFKLDSRPHNADWDRSSTRQSKICTMRCKDNIDTKLQHSKKVFIIHCHVVGRSSKITEDLVGDLSGEEVEVIAVSVSVDGIVADDAKLVGSKDAKDACAPTCPQHDRSRGVDEPLDVGRAHAGQVPIIEDIRLEATSCFCSEVVYVLGRSDRRRTISTISFSQVIPRLNPIAMARGVCRCLKGHA